MHDETLMVGFIGLGQMGMPMLQHLSKAGMATVAYDVDPIASKAAAQLAHVTVAQSVAAVTRGCQALFTCLPTLQSIREVYLGEAGIGANALPGLITCECSTITPDLAIALQAAMHANGVQHLDTPVFGTPQHAQTGNLYFLVSGEAEIVTKVEIFFQTMGRGYRYVGATGNANRIKLIQNALGCVNAVATAEALAICKLTGIDLLTFVAVVKECDGIGNSTYFDRYAETVANGVDGGAGRLLIAAKDMQLLGDIAAAAQVDAPLMKHTEQTYTAARDAGLGSAEFTEVARVIESRLGKRLFYDV
jgi:3-hydroxyisobutyrate dehydrogenase-like beta-hydroxyacid dehydrogenase